MQVKPQINGETPEAAPPCERLQLPHLAVGLDDALAL